MTPSDDQQGYVHEELRRLREEVAQLRAAVGGKPKAEPRATRTRAAAWVAGALLSSLLAASLAFADPASPLPCPSGDLYCFAAGTPALAEQVNSNFARLQSWLVEKVGDVATQQLQVQGPIVRGASQVSTSDLGLYSQTPDNWIRIVSNSAPIRFFTDGGSSGVGTTAALTVEQDSAGVTAPVLNSTTFGATTANIATANITALRASNLVYSDVYTANAGASENGYGEAFMTSTTNSFCFMIGMRAGDDNDEDDAHHCEIQVSGTTWWLRMWTNSDESAEHWCKARCFTYR